MSQRDFIPFDITCFTKLESRFQALFEPKLINEICQNGNIKKYAANKILVDIGTPINFMPLVISGSIKVMTEDDKGNELLLYYLEVGETCAVTLNCCTTEAKSSIRAITENNCEILLIPVRKMDEWMIKFKTWRTFVLSSYNQRLNEMVYAFDNIVFHSLEERLVKYLQEKSTIAKSHVLTISHQDIANDLYTTRVSISRLMRKLEINKKIEQQRNRVVLLERPIY